LHQPEHIYRQQGKVQEQDWLYSSGIAVRNKHNVAGNCDGSKRHQPLHAKGGQHQARPEKAQGIDRRHLTPKASLKQRRHLCRQLATM
jgi:hypothetical protein